MEARAIGMVTAAVCMVFFAAAAQGRAGFAASVLRADVGIADRSAHDYLLGGLSIVALVVVQRERAVTLA